ncbi:hypothetical protein DsansV1_C32g0219821 [Dioscorea sansibarensis]
MLMSSSMLGCSGPEFCLSSVQPDDHWQGVEMEGAGRIDCQAIEGGVNGTAATNSRS